MFGRKHAKDEVEQFDYNELLALVRPLLTDRLLPLFTSMSKSGPLSLHGFTNTVREHDEAHIVEYMNTITAAFGVNKLEAFSDDDRHVIEAFMHYDAENNDIDEGVFNPDFYTLYDEFLSKYHPERLGRVAPDAFGGVDVAPASKASLSVFTRDAEPDDAVLIDDDDDDNIENEPLDESDDEAAARAAALLSADEDEAQGSDVLSGALDEDNGPERDIDEIMADPRTAQQAVTQPVPEFGSESVSQPVSQPQETRYMTQAPQGVDIKTSEQLSADDLPSMDLKTPNAAKPDTSMNDIVASAISAAQRADNTDPFEDKTEVPDALPVDLSNSGIDESGGFVATMNTTIIEDDPDEFEEPEESDGFDEPDEEFDGSDNDDFGDEPPEEEIPEPVEIYDEPEDVEPDDLSADGLDDEIGATGDEQHLVGASDAADGTEDDTEDATDAAPDTTLNPPAPPQGAKSRADMKAQAEDAVSSVPKHAAGEAVTPMDVDATDAIAYQRPMTEILMSFGVPLDNVGHTRVGAKNISAPGAVSVNSVFPSRLDDDGEDNKSDSGNGGQEFQRDTDVKTDEKDKMIDENGVIMDF